MKYKLFVGAGLARMHKIGILVFKLVWYNSSGWLNSTKAIMNCNTASTSGCVDCSMCYTGLCSDDQPTTDGCQHYFVLAA